ncbi:ShlB/FhaC/HecB family hemolysin secretion/activation protein, partial [uncultured Nevskia sp.]|uniref:ShlB/FhaC/HecB family hemolysin secretion/activation protein n=1 Tax=uncultured Nevskia sp. TaxID=228950 RepID=UPI0025CB79DE
LTDQPLISNEQFSAGGADTVRGYLEASALGDYGISSTMELRSPPLADYLDIGDSFRPVETLRAYAFADSAVLRVRQPIADTPSDLRLASFGFGFDFRLLGHVSGSVDWANPINSTTNTRAGDSRVLFRVLGSF